MTASGKRNAIIVARLLVLQVIITLVAMAVSFALKGQQGLAPAAFGGLTGIVTSAYYALRFFPKVIRLGEGYAVKGMMATQLSKYALVIAMLYIALKVWDLSAAPLILTFMATQCAYWLILMFNPNR
ncbi:MAG: ATP synthase subunit I [Pseudomonadota bacterium]